MLPTQYFQRLLKITRPMIVTLAKSGKPPDQNDFYIFFKSTNIDYVTPSIHENQSHLCSL